MIEFITQNTNLLAGGTASVISLFLLKLVPNEDIKKWVETSCFWIGTTLTLGLYKWKYTKKYWNKIIEPYFIDLIDNVAGAGIKGLIKGLKSDK